MKTACLAIAILFLANALQTTDAALTVTFSGEPNSTTAVVTVDGFLVLPEYEGPSFSTFVSVVVPSPINLNVPEQLGGSLLLGSVLPSPFSAPQFDAFNEQGPGTDTAQFTITDTSNGDTILSNGSILNITHGASGFNFLSGSYVFPDGSLLDAGDRINFSGSFDLQFLSGTFGSRLNQGISIGGYNGQPTSIEVFYVPEPSGFLLCLLSLIACLSRRRRS